MDYRKELEKTRRDLQSIELSKERYLSVLRVLDVYGQVNLYDVQTIKMFCDRIGEAMQCCIRLKKTDKKNSIENKIAFDELYIEIKNYEENIKKLEDEIQYCLKNNLKTEWKIHTSEKNTKIKLLAIKQKNLETMIQKNDIAVITNEVEKSKKIAESIVSDIDYSDIKNLNSSIEIINSAAIDIDFHSKEIGNILNDQNCLDDDFDKAYEKYVSDNTIK